MSTKPPADPPMDRGSNPVRPAPAPAPRKPAAPPPRSGFQRFVLLLLLLVIAFGGAFGAGYLVKANEMQLDRNDLLQQQLDAQKRILALEQQIAEMQERRSSGNRVELDLTEVFEPIREAVGRIALVRMGEISRELTTELTRMVETDLPALDDPANAAGAADPGGGAVSDQAEPEAAAAGDESPPGADGPNALQPSSAALDATEPARPEAADGAGEARETAPAAAPAASNRSSPADELPLAEIERDPDGIAGEAGTVTAGASTSREPPLVADLGPPRAPDSSGAPATEP